METDKLVETIEVLLGRKLVPGARVQALHSLKGEKQYLLHTLDLYEHVTVLKQLRSDLQIDKSWAPIIDLLCHYLGLGGDSIFTVLSRMESVNIGVDDEVDWANVVDL